MVYRSVEESDCYPPDGVRQWLHSGVFLDGGANYEPECVEGPTQCERGGCPHGGCARDLASLVPPSSDRGFPTSDVRGRARGICGAHSDLNLFALYSSR
ncbi:hypothetical protein Trydic_g650 [Trypoxylus dichotomus]